MNRSEFEQDQMKTTEERLAILEATVAAEQATISKLEGHKHAITKDITEWEGAIKMLQDELKDLNDILEDKTKIVEQVKRTTSKAARGLDQALKDISSKVGLYYISSPTEDDWGAVQNDEIEKLALDRSSIYRKCQLDEIPLPLLEGNLKSVPMEEVCL